MISTITPAVQLASELGLGVTLGGMVAFVLVMLLIEREMALAASGRLRRFTRVLMIAIAPLLVTYGMVVVGRLASFL